MTSHTTFGYIVSATAMAIALVAPGCGEPTDDSYGKSRGASLNGTSVLAEMLRERGYEVRAAIRLNDELAEWAGGIVRFAPYPGPPEVDEAAWLRTWLAEDPDRWLVYVVRDFDASLEYWKTMADDPTAAEDPVHKAEAIENRDRAANRAESLPAKAKNAAGATEWFECDTAWKPARTCQKLSGPWAEGIDAATAAITVHEPLKPGRGRILLEGDERPLVLERKIGHGSALVVANGSFLLNGAVVNRARRPLCERVIEWADRGATQVAMVEGSFVLGEPEMPTLWSLFLRLADFRWVAIQVALAALGATLARAFRLGRPRRALSSAADRPAEHALALGTLLARAGSAPLAREQLDRYRRWRFPRSPRSADQAAPSLPEASHGRN